MKWLTKFRISNALDSEAKLSRSVLEKIARSDDLRTFVAKTTMVDRELRGNTPQPNQPPELHASIMQALHYADRQTRPDPKLPILPWISASAAAAFLLLALWWLAPTAHSPQGPETVLAPAGLALETSQTMAQSIPSMVIAPLSQEWQRLNRDLDNTAQFVLASLP